ncbi:cysteine-rich repeat secretory protein 38-like isoform X2 [Pistacia vera]|uniref:cysteine-rich repeat secretory protein 38-like isoform X2 n=1 Tax=Pistacia vera TaxID=55513 RepID=UPI001262FF51|nr:cysteine-rich repeat secretory protein 38-like isoform X2 [Pistacia vera]
MASLGVLLLAVTVALHLVALTINAKQEILQHFCLSEPGNFSENSAYKSNLNRLLSSLSSNTKINYGFYIASSGQDPDIVRGMALCRGDVKPDICRGCINDSSLELSKLCPNQKEAVIWYDYCMLRTLLDRLIKKAASGGCHRKFARGNRTTPSCQTIYALVQCTPDLSEQQCIDCLNNATALIPTACAGKQGCRVIAPSCNFRYEKDFIFYDTTANHQGHGHLNCRQNKN